MKGQLHRDDIDEVGLSGKLGNATKQNEANNRRREEEQAGPDFLTRQPFF